MIDKIINEWTYQLESGYPTKDSDYEILRSVLQEMNMLSEQEIDQTIYQAKGLYEQEPESESLNIESIQSILVNTLKLPSDVINQIVSTYNGLSTTDQQSFNENFRTHTIESFVAKGWQAFKEFFLVNVGGARGGMGNGEISILLGVKDSMPGGTGAHDIIMSNGEWEVKELKSGKFDPAKFSPTISEYSESNLLAKFFTAKAKFSGPISEVGVFMRFLANASASANFKTRSLFIVLG